MLRNTLRLPCVLQFSLHTHTEFSEAVPARRWQREAVWRWQRGAVAARGGGSEGRWQRDGGS